MCIRDRAGRGQDLAAEVGAVQGGVPDRLVDGLELPQGEFGRAEGRGQAGVLQLGADPGPGVGQDHRVVEGQRPDIAHRHPARPVGVAAALRGRLRHVRDQGGEGDRHHPHPGVAVRLAVRAQLLQVESVDDGARQSGLLGEFAPGGRLRGLPGQEEAAGERPGSRVRVLPAPDEEHVQGAGPDGEDREVDRHREGFECVGVVVRRHRHTDRVPAVPGPPPWVQDRRPYAARANPSTSVLLILLTMTPHPSLNGHPDYKHGEGSRTSGKPAPPGAVRAFRVLGGPGRFGQVRAGGRYRPTSRISMPTSVLVRRRSQPDFWSPSSIGPKEVRTSFSTGKPASDSIRRTMCLRPSWRVTSTR